MEVLVFVVVVIALIAVAIALFIALQGDAKFEFLVEQRSNCKLEELRDNKATFSCIVPFVNKGTQEGTIMDCYPRHLLPQEQYDGVELASRIELEESRRNDGYFESVLIGKGTGSTIILTLIFTAKNGDIRQAIDEMVDFSVDVVYQAVARSYWYINKNRVVITASELIEAIKTGHAEV